MGLQKTFNIKALGAFDPSSGGSGGSVVPGSSDVVDIVDTYTDLTNYDTSKLKDNDIIKVLSDSTHSDLSSYYRWNKSSGDFTFIGTENSLTFLPFNSNWVTNSTTETFLSNVFNDTNAKPRMAYMGALTCSDLPFNGNAEAVITILPSTVSTKVVHATITSGTDSPYRWECSYYIQNSTPHYTGWIGFQPELPTQSGHSGEFLTTDGSTLSWAPSSASPSSATWYTNNTGTTITILDTTNYNFVEVYKNGLLLEYGQDYTISGTTLTLASALASDDKIAVKVNDLSSVQLDGIEALLHNINSGDNE